MTTMEQQSNDGDGNGINDGNRFVSSSAGKLKELMINRHVRVSGLNNKKVKVEGNKEEKETNSYLHSNGLNDKNPKVEEKGEKVVRKKRENSLVRDSGLINKIIEMAAEWSKS